MGTETLADKIQRIRNRIVEIEKERSELPAEEFSRRSELLDEEHTLEARLSELRDEAAAEGVGIAEKQAGDATDYERVPDLPEESGLSVS